MAASLALLLVPAAASAAHAHGSDDPTPYRVTSSGIELPAGATLGDDADVNVRWTRANVTHAASLHTGHAGDSGHRWASAHTVTWAELGVPTGACVTWVQVSGYDEHFGEGGQKPVSVTQPPNDCPRGTPTGSPTPPPSATPAAPPTPHAWPRHHHPGRHPQPTSTTSAPAPSTTASAPAPAHPATGPVRHGSTPEAHRPAPGGDTPASHVEDSAPTSSATAAGTPDDDTTPDATPSPTAYVLADDDATLASTGGDARGPAALAGALVLLGAAATVVARARRGAPR
ncbi:hypothetical protein [Cellulomonas alba]|uniref:Gram-positive cocci surface proteins LPxTG domain-containing protein n=1 Tax=Cellulomonas alba TaxID=3053467 RepID=A0ABT7SEI9_9CELL|nr:hypothetical protein [Cellulomonas alba]MDM7854604.1 hypothetical protein [Cellulomonas alba]